MTLVAAILLALYIGWALGSAYSQRRWYDEGYDAAMIDCADHDALARVITDENPHAAHIQAQREAAPWQ